MAVQVRERNSIPWGDVGETERAEQGDDPRAEDDFAIMTLRSLTGCLTDETMFAKQTTTETDDNGLEKAVNKVVNADSWDSKGLFGLLGTDCSGFLQISNSLKSP